MKRLSLLLLVFTCFATRAQQHEVTNYIDDIDDIDLRASNVVAQLDINSTDKKKIKAIVVNQYLNIEKIEAKRNSQLEKLEKTVDDQEKQKLKSEEVWTDYKASISKLHDSYLHKLSKKLSDSQIVQVKDAMTYQVMPKTYSNFLDMFQNLNENQKKMIYDHLVEARENAMNVGTHKWQFQWFAKYRGKINNILASQGIELHHTSKAWEKKQLAKKNDSK